MSLTEKINLPVGGAYPPVFVYIFASFEKVERNVNYLACDLTLDAQGKPGHPVELILYESMYAANRSNDLRGIQA